MSKYPEEIEAGKGRVKDCSKMYQGRAVTLKTAYGEVILTSSNIDTLRAQAHLLMPVGFDPDDYDKLVVTYLYPDVELCDWSDLTWF